MAAGAFDRSQPPIRVDSSRAEMNPNCGVAESFSRASLPSFTEFYRVSATVNQRPRSIPFSIGFYRVLMGSQRTRAAFPFHRVVPGF